MYMGIEDSRLPIKMMLTDAARCLGKGSLLETGIVQEKCRQAAAYLDSAIAVDNFFDSGEYLSKYPEISMEDAVRNYVDVFKNVKSMLGDNSIYVAKIRKHITVLNNASEETREIREKSSSFLIGLAKEIQADVYDIGPFI